MQEVGERIRQLRTARGLSQIELGEGRYSGSYISHIESGRRQPNADVLEFLAARLGLAVSELDPNDVESVEAEVVALLAGVRRLLAAHQWDAAVRTARQAAHRAAELQRDSRRWEVDFLLATALISASRYDEAAELADDLAARSVVAGNPDLRAEARTLAARAHRAGGRLAEAADRAAAAVVDASSGSVSLLATALVSLLGSLVSASRWPEVDDVEARLRELVDHLPAAEGTKVAWALGNTSFHRGQITDGLAWHERAAELCDPNVDLRAWARLHQSTAAQLAGFGGDLDQAQRHFDLAHPIVLVLGNSGDLADLRLVQAKLFIRRADYDSAIALLEHLSAEAATLEDLRLEAEVRESWATALLALGRLEPGREQLRLAAGCFERAQAPQRALAVWHRFAEASQGPA